MRFPPSLHGQPDAAPSSVTRAGQGLGAPAPEHGLAGRSRALTWTLVVMALGLLAAALYLALQQTESTEAVWSVGSPGAGGPLGALPADAPAASEPLAAPSSPAAPPSSAPASASAT